jgi:hypothetical protein
MEPPAALPSIMESSEPASASQSDSEEQGRRGQRAYKRFVEATGAELSQACILALNMQSLYLDLSNIHHGKSGC